ncbi:SDR family oxidoreductase [Sansalvadorimonas sp. 2012CJ34-2]|uniref:SDR family oxidoreductase n=1 Tax=Parendozoicomonas callyspongiae TaxID=2942213 RepID=A0ABT0PEG7_9GAMM|nr:SDR family oxidoreductase [Sansalvadorimonas sp. 2012CJ34-2]MCL6269765.1 SDR family oxidoreductase [Sansalvadorimonas sp. 2012CJ34-2]
MKQTVLITGCSTGIGRALALEFNKKGYCVWATARNIDSLTDLVEAGIHTATLDVTNEQNRQDVIDQIISSHGRIDILVNNAGYGAMGPVAEAPESALRQQFETNVFAPTFFVKQLLPVMKKQGSGLIINLGSVSGILTTPFSGMYCASKAALHSLNEAMVMELKPFGIDVVNVQPGGVKSSFGSNASKTLGILPKDSVYNAIKDAIEARAVASQNSPSSPEGLAEKVVSIIASGKRPQIIRYGHGSIAFPFMARWLPGKLVRRVLSHKFKLDQLA